MTEKLFYKDSYIEEFEAVVLGCEARISKKGEKEGYEIALDRTAFFPEGGGQSGDVGWIQGVEVIDTKERGGVVYHRTKEALPCGTHICGKVNFEVRFDRMQQHSGEHILSGLVHKKYGYANVGFHLGEDATTLDFNGELSKEQVEELEKLANRAVFENVSVEVCYPSKKELLGMEYRSKIEIEGQIRIVSIPGYDVCACCAPHVKRTGEIGLIKVLGCERHRGGCRMTIACGMRALMDYRQKQRSVSEVSVLLSAKPERIEEAVLRLKEQQGKIREHLNRMQAAYLEQKLMEIGEDAEQVCIFEEDLDGVAVRNFVNGAMERCKGICGAFVGNDENGYHYILGSKHMDVRGITKELNQRFQGKGGGKPEMVQGSLSGRKEEIQTWLLENG